MVRPLSFLHIALLGAASALPSRHVLHEKRSGPVVNAIDRRRVDGDVLLPMRVGLKQNDDAIRNGEDWLMSVSHPDSPNYGLHWSSDDVVDAFKPSEADVSAVKTWLAANGITKVTHSDNKMWLAFDIPASKAESLLKTTYFEHERSNGMFVASVDEYHLPEHVSSRVDFIMPGLKASDITGRSKRSRLALRKRSTRSTKSHARLQKGPLTVQQQKAATLLSNNGTSNGSLANCNQVVTPACIRALYNFTAPDPTEHVCPDNTLGLFEEGDLYYQGDLDKFFKAYTNIPVGTSPIFDPIDGGQSPPTGPNDTAAWDLVGGENDLDLECAFPIIYPQNISVFQTDDPYWAANGNGFFNTFLDGIDGSYCTYSAYNETGDSSIDPVYPDPRKGGYKGQLQCGVYNPPYVISTSYSGLEGEFPYNYQRRQCNEYLKLALQGTTIFVASGDDGVGPCDLDGNRVFEPDQISGCPWITNVGATQIAPNASVHAPEIASNPQYGQGVSSGGGFSNIFPAPSYQKAAVAKYFAGPNAPTYLYYTNGSYANNTGRYNRDGRGFPDLAAVGQNIATYVQDEFGLIGGTSASSPIVAALFNRVVEERIRAGKKGPLGFINPTLYENAQVLNDITVGTNPDCGTQGFEAAEGWDPVTGLGTPDYGKVLDLFLNMP